MPSICQTLPRLFVKTTCRLWGLLLMGTLAAVSGLLTAASAKTAPPQRALTSETINRLKEATVFIQTPSGSGTGFLARLDGDGVFIVTNNHVISERIDYLVGETTRAYDEVDVVFFSGAPGAQKTKARVFATFRSADLALLQCETTPSGVTPLVFDFQSVPFETMSVLAAGFPFGEDLSGGQFPSPTIVKANVSSLRYSHAGELESVQLDTNLNPGNSGGPILGESGKVLGVAVAAIRGTDISFMVPARDMRRFIDGAIDYLSPSSMKFDYAKDQVNQDLVVVFADPFRRIAQVGFNRLTKPPDKRDLTPPFRALGEPMQLYKNSATQQIIVKMVTSRSGNRAYWYQSWIRHKNSAERVYHAPFAPGFEARDAPRPSVPPPRAKPKDEDVLPPPRPLPAGLEPVAELDTSWHERARAAIGEGLTLDTPGPLKSAFMAGNGRFLVGTLAHFGTIVVFDFKRMAWTGFFPAVGRVHVAAGANRLVIYRELENKFEIYDLDSMRRLRELENPMPWPCYALGMGSANGRRLFTAYLEGDRKFHPFLLDTESLALVPLDPPPGPLFGAGSMGRLHFDPAAEVGLFKPERHGNRLFKLNATRVTESGRGACFDRHFQQVKASGLYSCKTKYYFRNQEKFRAQDADFLVFAEDGDAFLIFPRSQGGAKVLPKPTLHSPADNQKMARLNLEIPKRQLNSSNQWGRPIYFFQQAGFIAYFGAYMENITMVPFDLKQTLSDQHGGAYLFGLSSSFGQAYMGTAYRQRLRHASDGKASYQLIEGPQGLILSAKGVMVWANPYPEREAGFHTIRYRIGSRNATADYSFSLYVD